MIKNVNGVEVEMTTEEIAERENERGEVAIKEAEIEAIKQRMERNILLAETDYAALPDTAEMSDAMKTYRQALRDVPSQEGFPSDITWPEKPEE